MKISGVLKTLLVMIAFIIVCAVVFIKLSNQVITMPSAEHEPECGGNMCPVKLPLKK